MAGSLQSVTGRTTILPPVEHEVSEALQEARFPGRFLRWARDGTHVWTIHCAKSTSWCSCAARLPCRWSSEAASCVRHIPSFSVLEAAELSLVAALRRRPSDAWRVPQSAKAAERHFSL